jgi:hypothetical protein
MSLNLRLFSPEVEADLETRGGAMVVSGEAQGCMARDGLPKVVIRPAMPNPFLPSWQTPPETADLGVATCRVGGLWPSSSLLDTPRVYASGEW